ncbi:putative prefoldin subunit 2 [Capsicum annuum]|uniref:Prefoldin subunit 2 n=2 Tax=Capsicum TaxID=4071 RepID=A0A2G2Z6G8_CAPAN|nr:putative prefoldin subunit 2 [Capsicum annuum]
MFSVSSINIYSLVEITLRFYFNLTQGSFDILRKTNSLFCVCLSAMASKAEEPINEQAIANIYSAMRSEITQIYSKITELEMEVSEHSLVINAIQPLDPARRCYRMIGGVLVERTIKEVLPAVQRNKEGIEEVIARLNEALEKKKKEISDFEAKYKIRIRKPDEVKEEGGRKEGSAQGVLVGPAAGSNE